MPKINNSGQILIGLIITMAILAILSQVVISLVLTSYQTLSYTNARTNAKDIANEQVEIIRNLPYVNIGTVGGIPAGSLVQSQTTVRNGLTYTILASVIYIDDTFDGVAPADLLPTDYKRVRVDVSWGGLAASNSNTVTLISDIAPEGVETNTGGGTLSILVFDSSGNPVPNANVNILATTVTPNINLNLKTGSNGRVLLPGATACNSCYNITVTKDLYSTDRTYKTSEVANPAKPPQTILAGKLTSVSFAIDLMSNLNVMSKNDRSTNFSAFPNQSFKLRSTKIIGTDSTDNPVYKYTANFVTDATGSATINNLEWDNYVFSSLNAGYDVTGTNPLSPINIAPNASSQFKYSQIAHTSHSLFITFTDSGNKQIASVAATLKNGAFSASGSSGLSTNPDFGQLFFANLAKLTYTLYATVSGFVNYSGPIAVNGTTTSKVVLTPQ